MMTTPDTSTTSMSCDVAIIGGGPAGLMAAEVLARAGIAVQLFDAMPSVGRKFLLAGKGGLNLTHSEPFDQFVTRFGTRRAQVEPWLAEWDASAICAWARELGIETFVGSSGRVFPTDMKAAPLLRAWLQRLRTTGVQLHMRHCWLGWDDRNALQFSTPQGHVTVQAKATLLALGGGSWPQLGSTAAWVPWLQQRGVNVVPLVPANCGFDTAHVDAPADETRRAFIRELLGCGTPPKVGWSPFFQERFSGQPFKSVAIHFEDSQGNRFTRRGEFVATDTGVEGSLIYAASALLRDEIARHGHATFSLDLLPDFSPERVLIEVRHPRGSRSLGSHLKGRLGLDGIKSALLHEQLDKEALADPVALARAIKSLPITVVATRPLAESISTAGGVAFDAMDTHLMLEALPGVFCAGEMLDWEAPTGGYLLTASMASGVRAAQGMLKYLAP